MFDSWLDLLGALALVAVLSIASNLLSYIPDRLSLSEDLAARVPANVNDEMPPHTQDLRYGIIGQQRSDRSRRRWTLVAMIVSVVVVQAVPLNGYASGAIILLVYLATGAAQRAWDKVMVGMLTQEDSIRSGTFEEITDLSRIVAGRNVSSPFKGKWRPVGVTATVISVAIALIGWVSFVCAFGIQFRDVVSPFDDLRFPAATVVEAISGALLILLARLPVRYARTLALTRTARTDGYDVVYLRSFRDDKLTLRVRGASRGIVDRLTLQRRHGYERLIVASLDLLGSVVAIGEPNVRIPPVGAFRLFYGNNEWEAAVEGLLRSARLIVLSLGDTPSVQLEITKLRDLGVLDRALFVVPPVADSDQQARLRNLSQILGTDPRRFEPYSPLARIVAVKYDDGSATPIIASNYDYVAYNNAVLDAGFELLNDSPEAKSRNPSLDRQATAAMSLASSRRDGWPVDTYQVLCALIELDRAGRWRRLTERIGSGTFAHQAYMDRPAHEAGAWQGVSLTAHAASALRMSSRLAVYYQMESISDSFLAIGLLANPTSAACKALLAATHLSHAQLLAAIQEEVLEGTLEGY